MPLDISKIAAEHRQDLVRHAYAMVRDWHTAEDIVQEALIKANNKLDTYEGGSVRSWLLTITTRTAIDTMRKRRPDLVEINQLERGISSDHDLKLILDQAIQTLSLDEQEAFALVCVMGHSREEAAAIVGVPASTMRSRVTRAKVQLAELLEGLR